MNRANRSRCAPKPETLRIIGGQWRGRKLMFPAIEGLRPTTDRVRETLFNWLAPTINGACCLDLFAGSGALGLEALSRGAAKTTFVDASAQATTAIRQHLDMLAAQSQGQCVQAKAERWLTEAVDEPYDIVFLDPPFGQGLIVPVCNALNQSGRLAEGAMIYIETEDELLLELPEQWQVHRQKKAGQVAYYLCINRAPQS